MGCSCKDSRAEIEEMRKTADTLKELFIKRMTVDSAHNDRRRKDYNQAIFHWSDFNQEWRQSWTPFSMDMVLDCFDNAVDDYRLLFCDQHSSKCK